MGIWVKTTKEHHYGKRRKVGDRYEVPGKSALALAKAMGWAEEDVAPAPVPAPAPARKTAAKQAPKAAPKAANDDDTAPRGIFSAARKVAAKTLKRGSYLTRDMVADTAPDTVPAPLPAANDEPAADKPAGDKPIEE
jgi:hypothetical protein